MSGAVDHMCAGTTREEQNRAQGTFMCYYGLFREREREGSKERGNGRNLFLTGPANCGKTVLTNPLTQIFDAFCNPATGLFAWAGVADMLLLLEGH